MGDLTEGAHATEPWRVHGERSIYDSRWVRLVSVDVEPPGLERFEHHVVRLNAAAVAAVVDHDDRVLLLRRYRFVPAQWAWELPGGLIDPGEDAACAPRCARPRRHRGRAPVLVRHRALVVLGGQG
ncbi:NUDIX hydrolase [Paractinoplanes durhamensis]|uniref:Nudix hydrolase domain-containing protein n=1 Tax=Paractinoplanes durhamensis TaxID=113563 RepID=A0ABQ3Z007_9ACTN|nr:NUDIX domain-containing protein [Actinoplanes durhamensis]GIE03156.1 hypothetical protein Adu01nite_45060 [Actinoplanes durhamensis]